MMMPCVHRNPFGGLSSLLSALVLLAVLPGSGSNASPSPFVIQNNGFHSIIGSLPTLSLLLEDPSRPLFHEASVYIKSSNTLWVTSNQYNDSTTNQKIISITKISLGDGSEPTSYEIINSTDVPLANGGVKYKDGILFCAQGTLSTPGGLAFMLLQPPYPASLLITNFYSKPFNSLNDVTLHSDGSLWFTDPIYGSKQGVRPPPQLPNQVYRYDPVTGDVRVVATGFGRPNGITFSPDEKTVYITDTDQIQGDGTTDLTRASTIYAFDVVKYYNQPFLTNQRVFAFTDTGIPDGIKCDTHGNVYSGCGDGVHVWSPGGVLLGKILLVGGVANLGFGRKGELFMLNEKKLWKAQLAESVRGA